MVREGCSNIYDELSCGAAILFCYKELMDPYDATGLNSYDMSKPCEDPEALCYPITEFDF
jgi:hypothetical protein